MQKKDLGGRALAQEGLQEVQGRILIERSVDGMSSLFNTICKGTDSATSVMTNGDTAIMAVGSYKCTEGTCASSNSMLIIRLLYGDLKCAEDNASCILDGENSRRVLFIQGGRLTIRAITFSNGEVSTSYGAGVYIYDDAEVDIELCVFSYCRTTSSSYGGGAIYVFSSGTSVNVYGTVFNGNTAVSRTGGDIFMEGGTITIHNTCPSPYSSNTPIQGKMRRRGLCFVGRSTS
jgi:hypothetical protein